MTDEQKYDESKASAELDRHQERTESAMLAPALAAYGEDLTDEQRRSAEAVARSNAERDRRENGEGIDAEQARGGHIRAGEKFTGVDPIEGDAFAVTQGHPADLVKQGEAENERTLEQQRSAAAKTAPTKKAAAPKASGR